MLHLLKRHPIPVRAFFRHALVLTYALPRERLARLLPPGLELDTFNEYGFLAIALVQTERLRPSFVPACLGQNFFLSGYRVFARYHNHSGQTLRGLRILRSDTDRRLMVTVGNLLTHYHYRLARVSLQETADRLDVSIRTFRAEADLDVSADLAGRPALLPHGSPFDDLRQARRFAGPLPFTFDYEAETNAIVLIEGVRERWNPQSVSVEVGQNTFFDQSCFSGVRPVLASAFHVHNVPYRWKRGVREPLVGEARGQRDRAPIYSGEVESALRQRLSLEHYE